MAAATYTSSSQTATPRMSHEGVTVAKSTFTLDAAGSLSGSDVIFAVKIPNGAWILDGYVQGTTGSAQNIFKIGTDADDNACGSTITLSATTAMKRFDGTALPFKVSLSDDANPQWTWLKLEHVSGSSTATASINVVVMYARNGAV